MTANQIEEALNELIAEATKNGGHLYIVDKMQNAFALKITQPVKIQFYAGYKEKTNERKD